MVHPWVESIHDGCKKVMHRSENWMSTDSRDMEIPALAIHRVNPHLNNSFLQTHAADNMSTQKPAAISQALGARRAWVAVLGSEGMVLWKSKPKIAPPPQKNRTFEPMEGAPEPLILGIESSCDDTSAAVVRGNEVLSNVVANQALHAEFGGVVPEWASRAHLAKIHPVVDAALKKAGVDSSQLDAVAYTLGPGLQGSLHVGTAFAKSFAWALGIPSIPVHHMRAHILAHMLAPGPFPTWPFLCLTVSGGHTQLVQVDSPSKMQVLGQTRDDAAGEAFDKVAKLLGLPYPGGPLVDRLAAEGDELAFAFTRPKLDGYDWSFSGLKTQVLHFLQREQQLDSTFVERRKADICASVQATILDMLLESVHRAVAETGIQEVAIAGGVSANSGLRARLKQAERDHGWTVHVPPMAYCTDNAAMIAAVGLSDFKEGRTGALESVPSPRLPALRPLAASMGN